MSEHPPSSPAAPVPTPGGDLRKVREEAGLTLQDVSDKTLISLARLRSLEQDDYAQVGTCTYVTGYTRAYARVLGIDPDPYVRQMEAVMGVEREALPSEGESGPIETYKKPLPFAPFVIGGLILVVLLVVGLVMLISDSGSAPVEATENAIEAVPVSVTPEPSPPEVAPVQEPEPRLEPADLEAESPAPEFSLPEQSQPEAVPVVEEAPAMPVPSSLDSLSMRFSEECWVQIYDATGERLYVGVRAPGESLSVTGLAPFAVKLGNARVVEIELNNEPVTVTPRPGFRTLEMTIGS